MRRNFVIFLYLLVHTIILLKPPGAQAENPEWMYFHDIESPRQITAIDNSIYLTAGDNYVIRLNLENLTIDTIARIFSVSSIAQDNEKNIWMSTRANGIYKYSNGNLENYTPSNSGLPDSRVYDLVVDANNIIWCATRQGLAKFDGSDWEVFHFEYLEANGYISSLAIDKFGSIWVTNAFSPYRIAKFNEGEFLPYNGENTGVTSINWCQDIDFDSKGNKWFVAGHDLLDSLGGLIKYDENSWTIFDESNSGMTNDQLSTLAIDSNDIIWTGGFKGGLHRFDGENWTNLNITNSGLTGNDVRKISVDKYNNKWIYTINDVIGKFVLEVYNEGGVLLPTSANIAIETLKNKEPFIYPNPASEIITVSDIVMSERKFTITNILGQLMLGGEFYHEINISSLPTGYYFLHLEQFHLSFFKI